MSRTAEANIKYKHKIRDGRRDLMNQILGSCCVVCCGQPNLLVAHRKDGSEHPKFQWQTLEWVEKELRSNEYVRLCAPCHKAVHWVMDHFGFDWDQIVEQLQMKLRA